MRMSVKQRSPPPGELAGGKPGAFVEDARDSGGTDKKGWNQLNIGFRKPVAPADDQSPTAAASNGVVSSAEPTDDDVERDGSASASFGPPPKTFEMEEVSVVAAVGAVGEKTENPLHPSLGFQQDESYLEEEDL